MLASWPNAAIAKKTVSTAIQRVLFIDFASLAKVKHSRLSKDYHNILTASRSEPFTKKPEYRHIQLLIDLLSSLFYLSTDLVPNTAYSHRLFHVLQCLPGDFAHF